MNKNFLKACKKLGIAPTLPGVEGLPEAKAKRVTAEYQLDIIADATGKRTNNFSDGKLKYTGWLVWSASVGGLVSTLTFCTCTRTRLGARFWFEDGKTAREFTEGNIDLINQLHQAE